jgi:hypothetical protein
MADEWLVHVANRMEEDEEINELHKKMCKGMEGKTAERKKKMNPGFKADRIKQKSKGKKDKSRRATKEDKKDEKEVKGLTRVKRNFQQHSKQVS